MIRAIQGNESQFRNPISLCFLFVRQGEVLTEIYHVVVLSTDYELEANYFISALTLNIYSL